MSTIGRIEFGPRFMEPMGIMPRQSPTRLGVDNHALRAQVKLLRTVLQKVAEAKDGPLSPELQKEVDAVLQHAVASDILDALYP